MSTNSLTASSSSGAAAAFPAVASSADTTNSGHTVEDEVQAAMVAYDPDHALFDNLIEEQIQGIWEEDIASSRVPNGLNEAAPTRTTATVANLRRGSDPREADLVSPSGAEAVSAGLTLCPPVEMALLD